MWYFEDSPMHAPLRGIFGPHSVNVDHYVSPIQIQSPTKCNAQLPESNLLCSRAAKFYVSIFTVIFHGAGVRTSCAGSNPAKRGYSVRTDFCEKVLHGYY